MTAVKQFLIDSFVAGLGIKAPCKAVSITPITLSGEQTVNGVAVTDGDRVLVTAQAFAVDNGIYNVSTGAWTRALDFDGNRDVAQGTLVLVSSGAAGNLYEVTTADPITIGTSALTFSLRYGSNAEWDQTALELAAGVTPVNKEYQPGEALRFGTNTTPGTTDMSTPILNAHLVGNKVTYRDEDFLFTSGTNPDFSGGVELIGAEWNSATRDNILRFDRGGELIGLQMNHLQDTTVDDAITTGTSTWPPISTACINGPVDLLAHWYDDAGQEYGRLNRDATWYTWEWNFTTASGYDTQRVPVQGYYRGDDPKVLDWQCYWMREAGITAVNPLTTDGMDIDTATWDTPSDNHHFLYQLFNNCPNFKGLKYFLWMTYDASAQTQWEANIDNIYLEYPNFYTVKRNGKTYPVMYCFELGVLVTLLGGASDFKTFCGVMSTKFKNAGYDGCAIFGRHAPAHTTVDREELELEEDCLLFGADYDGNGGRLDLSGTAAVKVVDAENTYSAMVDSYLPYNAKPEWASGVSYAQNDVVRHKGWLCVSRTVHTSTVDDQPFYSLNGATNWFVWGPVSREIPGCHTSHLAVAPHPTEGNSYFSASGTTPDLFEKFLRKAVDASIKDNGPRIVTIYNVSEWAEGGPGLIPNIADGWGYLDAVKNVMTDTEYEVANITQNQPDEYVGYAFLSAGSTIPSRYRALHLDESGNRTLTATPTIEAGVDGQRLRLIQTGSNTITLQDDATLTDSDLFLSASTIALAPYDSIDLEYIEGKGWIQAGQTNVL